MKVQIQDYFRLADFLCSAQDELATIKQNGHGTGYIDAFKFVYSNIPSISKNEMLYYSIHGLQMETKHGIFLKNPNTSTATLLVADYVTHLDSVVSSCFHPC